MSGGGGEGGAGEPAQQQRRGGAHDPGQISPALTTALGALSQHVKIVPMGDDESGTCIVETPEEIIDASVSTQMSNIRDILRDQMGAL